MDELEIEQAELNGFFFLNLREMEGEELCSESRRQRKTELEELEEDAEQLL